MAKYRLHRGYTAKGTFNTYMDYGYESGNRFIRVFKGHHLKFIKGNNSGFVQEGRTPDNMILPHVSESNTNANYSYFSSFFKIIMMLLLLLAYCKVVFGGVDRSPFDTGIDIAQQISFVGTSVKGDLVESLRDLKNDFAGMSLLSPQNWGSIDSFGTFLTSVGSMFTAPFDLFKFIFGLIVALINVITGICNFIIGV